MKSSTTIFKTWLVFILIGVSTIPILKDSFGMYLLIFSSLFTLRTLRINRAAILFLLLTVGLEVYHYIYFDDYEGARTRQLILVFTASVFIIYYIKSDFFNIYIKILYYFSLISFIFFTLYYTANGFVAGFARSIPGIFVKSSMVYGVEVKQPNPIFYNFDTNFMELGRNNGPFWEPTVFATMLIIAQIFNLLLNKTLFNKKGIIFTIAILTTFSTTGFLAYFLLLLFYFILSAKIKLFTKIALLTGALVIGFNLYTNLPFLSEKINNEIENTDAEIDKYGGDSRLASAIVDIGEVSQKDIYLLLGKGNSPSTRVEGPDKEVLRNCGDTALLVEWGIPYAAFYVFLLCYSFLELSRFYGINRFFALVFTLIVLLCSFSEVFLGLPIFFIFPFLGFIVKRDYSLVSIPETDSEDLQIANL